MASKDQKATPPKDVPATSLSAAALDIDNDVPIATVQLDGLAVMKIIKHSAEAHPSAAAGTLLGLELQGTLEVSNSFPLPTVSSGDDDDKKPRLNLRYQSDMVRLLKEVNADNNIVGFYQSAFLGAVLNQSLVDAMAQFQNMLKNKSVVVIHDLAESAQGNVSLRAFRLAPSFADAQRKGKFSTQSLIDHKLTFSSIFEEIPVRIHNTALLNAFLATLTTPPPTSSPVSPSSLLSSLPSAVLPPTFSSLSLNVEPVLSSALDHTIEALDEYTSEAGNVGFVNRQIAREKARMEAYLAKRKAENALRESQGLSKLPDQDVSKMFRVQTEPSRLPGLLLGGQLDGYAKSLSAQSGTAAVLLHATKNAAA